MYLASYIYIDLLLAPYLVFTSPIFYSSSLIGFHSKEKKSIFTNCSLLIFSDFVLAAPKEKSNKDVECKGETQEAISWYSRVLGSMLIEIQNCAFLFSF